MKKAILFTVFSWIIALTGYAQTFRVSMPKGLQCNDIPTWPITHSKKGNTDATKLNTLVTTQSNNKPVSALPPLPFIKFWLFAESSDSKNAD